MTALSDFETGKHYYSQQSFFFGRNVNITLDLIGVNGQAVMKFDDRKLGLSITTKEYSLSLDMNAVKPPVWHCDNGVLRMGIDDPKQTTCYYELLAGVKDKKGNIVGYCVVELLPGVYNEHIKVWAVLARIK